MLIFRALTHFFFPGPARDRNARMTQLCRALHAGCAITAADVTTPVAVRHSRTPRYNFVLKKKSLLLRELRESGGPFLAARPLKSGGRCSVSLAVFYLEWDSDELMRYMLTVIGVQVAEEPSYYKEWDNHIT